jgi:hypothetical protein
MRAFIISIVVISMAGSASADMIAHWGFDEAGGQTAIDSAGSNNGTINGATRTAGILGGALSFNGTNNYVNVLDAPSLRFDQGDSFSIAYWAKPQYNNGGVVISKLRSSGSGVFGYMSQYSPEIKKFDFYAERSGSYYQIADTPPDSITIDTWYFVTGVYDNKNMKIYLDGVLKDNVTFLANAGLTTPDADLSIGASYYDGIRTSYFKGAIDDVMIFNQALTGAEIVQLYNAPEPATLMLIGLGSVILRHKRRAL